MDTLTATLVIVITALLTPCQAVDKGFRLLFTSNKRNLDDYPVSFEKPRPPWLNGTYIRNGLGQFEMENRTLNHAFDGYAKLCSFRFVSPGVTFFTTRFLRTDSFSESKRISNVAPYLLFDSANPPFDSIEKMKALLHGIDNTNINIYQFKGSHKKNTSDFMAVSDFWQGYRFNPKSLKTRKRIDPKVPGGTYFGSLLPIPSTAHPVPEHGTSNHISFVSLMNPLPFFKSAIRVIRIVTAKQRELITQISVRKVPYMHSFGLSERFAIVMAAPLYINNLKMVKTARPIDSLEWYPKEPMKIYVVNIKTGEVQSFKTPAVFPMHHINSFEKTGNIIEVDFVTYADIEFIKSFKMQRLEKRNDRNKIPVNSHLMRFTINLKKKTVKPMTFDATPGYEFVNTMDMPVINEKMRHKRYCYVYGVTVKSDNVNFSNTSIVKKDLCNSDNDQVWQLNNHYPSEPWFVPSPAAQQEDDGVLLSMVLDGNNKKSYLGIWNATTMEQIDKGYLPFFVPFSLHGRYFADL